MNKLYEVFGTNRELEKHGVWVEYAENSQGKPMRVLLARAGGANTEYRKALERETKPFRRAIEAKTMSPAQIERIYQKVFVGHVLLGWENWEDRDGNPMEFTPDNVAQVIEDLPDLYADWQAQANSLALYRDEVREGDLGNSGRSSSTPGNKDL